MYNLQSGVTKYFRLVFLISLITLCGALTASAADVTLTWDANTESDLVGYKLFYGTSSGNYAVTVDVGHTSTFTITDLEGGMTYYFAATAYDTSYNESAFSEELVYALKTPNTAPNTPSTPTGPSAGYILTSYGFSTSGTDPDGDSLEYRLDWDDGEISAWGGAYSRKHAFSSAGNFCVKAQSIDIHGTVSGWSPCLNVNIVLQTHTITASTGANGSISPSDSVTVNHGANQTFSINPDPNYHVADVLADGVSVGAAASYTFTNVTQDHNLSASFARENQPPIADAGPDQNVTEGQTTALDGTNSHDPDGSISSYQWVQTSGPTVSLSDDSTAQPTFPAPAVGLAVATLTFDLMVTDSKGLTDTDACNIVVSLQNQPPTADAGPDQTVENGKTVTLNGANSTATEDGIASYKWVQTSGPTVSLSDDSAAQPTFPAPEVDLQGISLEFELTVTTANDLTNADSCIVNVTRQNEPPIADAGGNIVVTPGQSIVLDGSGSHDIDDGIAAYKWTQIEGQTVVLSDPQSPSPVFSAPDVGPEGESFIFVLTVADPGGLKDTDFCIVNVTWQNHPPLAVTNDYMETTEGLKIELDGFQSTDSDDEIINYRWNQVEGPPVTFDNPEAPQTAFNAPQAEPYGNNLVFTLKVKDKGGLKNSVKCSVFVFPKDSAPVAADDVYSIVQGVEQQVSAPGILANDSAANGQTLSSILVSDPDNGSLMLNADGSFSYTPLNDFVGTDSFTYFANDGTRDSNTATVSITVNQSNPLIYVSDITVGLNKKGPFYQAKALVIIKDDSGNIVKDAGITGRWMKNGSLINEVTAKTNGVGEAKLYSDKVAASSMEQLTIEISNVLKAGYTYDSNTNTISDALVKIP